MTQSDKEPQPRSVESPRRWSRVVDVVENGVIYTEDAERLILDGVTLPTDADRRAQAEAYLAELVSDTIVFYRSMGSDSLGRLKAEVWVGNVNVNDALRVRGYSG